MGLGKSSLAVKTQGKIRKIDPRFSEGTDVLGLLDAPERPTLPQRQAPPKTLFGDTRDATRRDLAKKKGRRQNVLTLDKLGKRETVLG